MAKADFLSTASVIPQSLPVREEGPHSELCPGLTERGRGKEALTNTRRESERG